jgi:hypothetical protein
VCGPSNPAEGSPLVELRNNDLDTCSHSPASSSGATKPVKVSAGETQAKAAISLSPTVKALQRL